MKKYFFLMSLIVLSGRLSGMENLDRVLPALQFTDKSSADNQRQRKSWSQTRLLRKRIFLGIRCSEHSNEYNCMEYCKNTQIPIYKIAACPECAKETVFKDLENAKSHLIEHHRVLIKGIYKNQQNENWFIEYKIPIYSKL